jgi:hypothetical protein
MLTLYLRIFTVAPFKTYTYVVIALVSAYGFAFFVVFLTNCSPMHQLWDPVPGGWCYSATTEQFTSIALNLMLDLAVLALPMPVLWRLQIPRHNKIFVTLMFSVGLS